MSVASTHIESAVRAQSHLRHARHWTSMAGLALADLATFWLTWEIFRAHSPVPAIVFFAGRTATTGASPIDIFTILVVFFVIARYLVGDYSRRQLFWDGARLTTTALIVTSLVDILLLILGGGRYSTFAVIGSWVFLILALPVTRQIARILMTKAGIWRRPTAVIGCGQRALDIRAALSGSLSLGFDVEWLVLDKVDSAIPEKLSDLKRLFASEPVEIAQRLTAAGCAEAVVAAEDMQSGYFADVIQRLMETDIAVAIIPSLRRLPLVGVSTSYFFGRDILLLQVRNNLRRAPHRFIKRMFDLFGSAVLLVLFSPLFAFIAAAIKRYDGGPVLYAQERVGRGGRPFPCLKFRTMAVDADARLNQWRTENPALYEEFLKTFKLKDDPRVTVPGRWLRKTSLDELPQLFNVLVGQMSLAGPRPVLDRELREYYGPAAQLYFRVRPGMTGLWQVSGRSDTTYQERVIYDEWYILNWSFWYDIVILIQTAWIVLSGKGAF